MNMFCFANFQKRFLRNITNKYGNIKKRELSNFSSLRLYSVSNEQLTNHLHTAKKMFKFTNYDCIGFDLDNTLARYRVGNMIEMEYGIVSKYLIQKKGFSEKHLSQPLDHNFIMKGLIIDNVNGNVLRISPTGEIIQATHGTKWLNQAEIIKYYPNGHWEPTDLFSANPLQTWNGPHSECMRTLLDYFDIVISLIFARIVDSIDETTNTKKYDVWPHLLECLIYMFDRDHFSLNKGEYFHEIKTNPNKYYYKCSNNLRDWLKSLRNNGIRLFLITGAHVDFATHTARNTIGEDWRDFFDIVICYAKKPGFFTMKRDFIGLNKFTETGSIQFNDLQVGGIYTHGNWDDLEKFMKNLSNATNPKVLYVGDNLVQDIYTPHVHSNCDTVAVCEELEAEKKFEFMNSWHPDEQFLCSTIWGSYFHFDNPKSATVWSNIITSHAKICIPNLEYVSNYPITQEFKSFF